MLPRNHSSEDSPSLSTGTTRRNYSGSAPSCSPATPSTPYPSSYEMPRAPYHRPFRSHPTPPGRQASNSPDRYTSTYPVFSSQDPREIDMIDLQVLLTTHLTRALLPTRTHHKRHRPHWAPLLPVQSAYLHEFSRVLAIELDSTTSSKLFGEARSDLRTTIC